MRVIFHDGGFLPRSLAGLRKGLVIGMLGRIALSTCILASGLIFVLLTVEG